MHNKILHLVFALFISCLAQLNAYPQSPNAQAGSNEKWIRVQSDNNEFSIEVPAKYKFYYNKDGFSVAKSSTNYVLKNMRMLSTFLNGTTLSFEIYEAKKGGLDAIYEQDIYKKSNVEKSTTKRNDSSIRQVTIQTDKFYFKRQYFSSKTSIYVLTAVSRSIETPEMRRFLDSVVFKPNTKDGADSKAALFATLPITDIGVEQELDNEPVTLQTPSQPPSKDENIIPVTIANKPRASYVDRARQNGVKGTIRLRTTLSADAFVPNIVVVGKALPDGLLRQALFAAIRLKFLPKENHGKPETVVVTIEYSFDIY